MKIEFDYSMLFDQLIERVKSDCGIAWAWHCNIACCVMNEGIHHKTSNIIAARFMKLAFGVDVTTFPEWKQFAHYYSFAFENA